MLKEELAEYLLKHHHGAEKAIISKKLESTLSMSGKELRKIINTLRCEGIPIASDQNGYYYAKTESEIEITIQHMRNRIIGISFAIAGLKRALVAFDDRQLNLLLGGGDDY